MKKILSLAFAFIAFMAISNAQFELRAGINLANTSSKLNDTSFEFDTQIGFHFGVTYEKRINDNISFNPGVLFSMKGNKLDEEEFYLKFNYLEIPLDLVYNTGSISIHAGPYVGLLMSAKEKDRNEHPEDIKEDLKPLDYGLNIGLAYNVTEHIGIGVNYSLGLVNIVDLEDDISFDISHKNKVLGIFVRYKLAHRVAQD